MPKSTVKCQVCVKVSSLISFLGCGWGMPSFWGGMSECGERKNQQQDTDGDEEGLESYEEANVYSNEMGVEIWLSGGN